jgi:hypothetical protein
MPIQYSTEVNLLPLQQSHFLCQKTKESINLAHTVACQDYYFNQSEFRVE